MPIQLTLKLCLTARPWTLTTDANYRVERPAPDRTHTITTTKNTLVFRITCVHPFAYQRIYRILM